MRILVVDDDKLMVDAIEFSLKNEGYEVITALDGQDAFEIIQNQQLDLIIADIMMPGLSGLELLNLLKIHLFKNTPVILTSSLNQGEVVSTAFSLGADDFIIKPINFDELLLRVKRYNKIHHHKED